jgi:UDP-N-acetylglucosamine--N-acetylmuramyl-(pentapeptide) pyrophosphoryl-undecaprenol N-acetylglucosamine transferase
VPTAIHEQNLRPGITNRLLGRVVRRVLVSFEESRTHFPVPGKVVFTGYPVRPEILKASRPEAAKALGLRSERPTLLIVGGSRGAKTINEAVKAGLPALMGRLPHLQVIVSTGPAYCSEVLESLRQSGLRPLEAGRLLVFPYIHEMHNAYAAADLVLCRSGGSVHELTARGLPAVLVPSPNVAYDQQMDNAAVMTRGGAARLVEDSRLSGEVLADVLVEMFTSPELLRRMAAASASLGRPAAGRAIAEVLLALTAERRAK